jgi:hypothetical protein
MFWGTIDYYKPVGDRDHEVLGMGSFGEYNVLLVPVTLQGLNTELVYFGIKKK